DFLETSTDSASVMNVGTGRTRGALKDLPLQRKRPLSTKRPMDDRAFFSYSLPITIEFFQQCTPQTDFL
ncbi:MAG: hypothetical protein WED15_04385, partial [Akkermansiaceae bacterium]